MIITADLHLGLVTDSIIDESGLPSKFLDTLLLFSEMIAVATKHKDKSLIIAGDLFDSLSLKPYIIEGLFSCFKEANNVGVKIYIIPGNHDCDARWTALVIARSANYGNVIVHTMPKLAEEFADGIKVDFLPHMPTNVEQRFLEEFKTFGKFFKGSKSNILISHANKSGAVNASEVEMEAGNAIEFNPAEFPSTYDFVFLGHIHKHQEIAVTSRGNSYLIIYPGAPPMCDFGESTLVKGYIEVEKQSGSVQQKFVPFKSRIHEYKQIKLNLISKDSLDLSAEKIKKAVLGKLLKITVYARDSLQIEEAKIRRAFNEFGKVVRFEYIIQGRSQGDLESENEEAILGGLNHTALLKAYLKDRSELDRDSRALSLKIGTEVINSCLNE